jgi:hypothetical protein
MESSGVTPSVAVRPSELVELAHASGPFATVYLTTEAEIENAAPRSELRWKALREHLTNEGAATDVLAAIDPSVVNAHRFGQCLAVVANTTGVVHVEHHQEPPKRDLGRWSPLPSLAPLIEWRQSSPPHVVVLADRRGADLFVFRPGAADGHREAGGASDPLTRSAPGGWSQRRYQQRAENTWERNADDVAKELARLVDESAARVVIAAGDVRALQLLQEALPDEITSILELVDGGRSPDGSLGSIADDVVRLVATVAARDTVAIVEKFREERGQADRAAEGPAATLAALAASQVEVLLVHDDPADQRQAWFGEEPGQLALNPDDVRELGARMPQAARLPDVAIWAALRTGAGVRIVPQAGGPGDGIGAILRWSN